MKKKCIRKHWALVPDSGFPAEAPAQLFDVCIYAITCDANQKLYLGSTKDARKRFSSHMNELRKGRHDNQKMQSAFRKYGEECFSIRIIEYVAADTRFEREQEWLDAWFSIRPESLMNLSRCASKPPVFSDLSPETRRRVAQKQRERTIEMHKDPVFSAARDARMRRLNNDPVFAEANRIRSSERMKLLNQNPDYIAKAAIRSAKAGSETMKRLHADPEFRARHRKRLEKLNNNLDSRKKCVEATKLANGKPCKRVGPDGSVSTYKSANEASAISGFTQASISAWCRKEWNPRDGSIWSYL